ncbi:NUDIX hydrolase [Marihabitans asiaticum]|uniref:8-oxo-dGTP diphosphatase n=1 Tax=Marihabitans asiaticum TaxID=415218 RepID=A0A560WHJ9_9MICO|nr:NUDIX hydrolase [Marihabitans asiaticum]TWD16984.1 8-oxo-dGTP diphosphatase [Marihabitans asiaticum]
MTSVVLAAGTLPWRRRRGQLQVAVVHRPKYDDWSWPKGKLDPGETFPVAAARETAEETGLVVRLGRPLPTSTYHLQDKQGIKAVKDVRYWAAEVVGGDGALEHEIDEVVWLDVADARRRLSYSHDVDQLDALVEADGEGALTTWPLALVRHAKAQPRDDWSGEDALRPLDARGRRQADELVPLLAAYGLKRLVSSPSTRAADTIAPYATSTGGRLRLKPGLSEEGYEADPGKATHHLRRLLERGAPAALCSHGPVLPDLVATLHGLVGPAEPQGELATSLLASVLEAGMAKGEVLICHVVGTGEPARVVSVERHHPDDRA